MSVLAELERRRDESAAMTARLDKMVSLVREVGEDGLSELVALLNETEPNGNRAANGNGHTKPAKPNEPRGREAVRRIVQDRPGLWTLTELRAEMERNGWFTTASGLDAAVKRLCANGEGRREGRGRYVFPANHGEGVDDETALSDGATIPLTP